MELKVKDLRAQKEKLIKIRDQIKNIEKNIDKTKTITTDERKIIDALGAINFLIDNMEPGKKFDEFIGYMTNTKNV